jgi:hypothetical protein
MAAVVVGLKRGAESVERARASLVRSRAAGATGAGGLSASALDSTSSQKEGDSVESQP